MPINRESYTDDTVADTHRLLDYKVIHPETGDCVNLGADDIDLIIRIDDKIHHIQEHKMNENIVEYIKRANPQQIQEKLDTYFNQKYIKTQYKKLVDFCFKELKNPVPLLTIFYNQNRAKDFFKENIKEGLYENDKNKKSIEDVDSLGKLQFPIQRDGVLYVVIYMSFYKNGKVRGKLLGYGSKKIPGHKKEKVLNAEHCLNFLRNFYLSKNIGKFLRESSENIKE